METLSFVQTLPYMAMGMGGIFAVILVLMLTITILNACTSDKKKKIEDGGDSAE